MLRTWGQMPRGGLLPAPHLRKLAEVAAFANAHRGTRQLSAPPLEFSGSAMGAVGVSQVGGGQQSAVGCLRCHGVQLPPLPEQVGASMPRELTTLTTPLPA